jgi:hypothetical protein
MKKPMAAAGLAIAATLLVSATPKLPFEASPENIQAHMTFLADDAMEGREAGTKAYDIAANYVASQFRQLGLKPGGTDGYFQRLTLVRYRTLYEGAVHLDRAGGPLELILGEDFNPTPLANGRDLKITGPLAFVSYGLVAPSIKRDDYAGLDVKGKIVVVLNGAPANASFDVRTYAAGLKLKSIEAAKHGAVGMIVINQPAAPAPNARVAQQQAISPNKGPTPWSTTWMLPGGLPAMPGVPVLASLTVQGAQKLFAGEKAEFDAIRAAGEAAPRFVLKGSATVASKGEVGETAPTENVIAVIEGSDPKLKSEYVVMSAHLDHIGIGRPAANGDKINNGALDNAVGIAILLEEARGFARSGQRPKRSVILMAQTAEEKGLIGSDYFVRNPTVPKASIVGDVNLDMPVISYDFTDVAAIGGERSTMGALVTKAAGRMGIKVSPDPVPELSIFTRSDHYNFIQQGIPAVFLIGGFENGGEKKFRDFYANCYHKQCDDLSQDLNYGAGAKWATLNYLIANELANAAERPHFIKGDFFGDQFAQ